LNYNLKFKGLIKKILKFQILYICKIGKIDLLDIAYRQMGVSNFENIYLSGENFLIHNILKKITNAEVPVFFDIGASTGDYSLELISGFPEANIYSFEPNPFTFKTLESKVNNSNIRCFNIGLGQTPRHQKIYTYNKDLESQHASILKEVLTEIHKINDISSFEIELTTLDTFCEKYNIYLIDFLKIDTEGNEFDILKGAKNLLQENRIRLIQFEFNEMNIISRVFLRDYFLLLQNFDFYRLHTSKLIPLTRYNTSYEIFKFQNILAINKSIKYPIE